MGRFVAVAANGYDRSRRVWFSIDEPACTILQDPRLFLMDDGLPDVAPVPEGDKPPYRVPSMAEIAEVRGTNGLRVISTFSGCGGSCLGFEMAGYEILHASEFVAEARETYMANHPGVPIDGRDVRDVTADELLAAVGLQPGEVDVLEGSPPCSAFSTAGKRSAGWGESAKYSSTEQRVDDLFFEFARLVRGIRPKVFVAENVAGLVKGVAKGYFQEIIAALRDDGAYRVRAQVLDAKWLGVPQSRSRVIFVGVREDLGRDPAFPTPLPYQYTLREALMLDGRFISARELRRDSDPERGFDEPAGTVGARGVTTHDYGVEVETRVVHDRAAFWSHGDITDRPSPTIGVSTGSEGRESLASQQFRVLTRSRNEGHWEGRFIPVDPDEPAPVVTAHGIGVGGQAQTALDAPIMDGDGHILDPETGQRIDLQGTAIEAEWERTRTPYDPVIDPQGEPHDRETGYRISLKGHAIAEEWAKLREGEQSDRFFSLIRPREDQPVPTLMQANQRRGVAGVTHSTQARKFTLGELRRLCGFPDDFVLTGTYAQRWERLGRAVPPPMMRAVAEAIRDQILT